MGANGQPHCIHCNRFAPKGATVCGRCIPDPVERFWTWVRKDPDPSGCWHWTGYLDGDGYGRFKLAGTPRVAHRFAYAITRAPVPDDMEVDHLCRVRDCVNPDHLEPVTHAVNTERAVQARRVERREARG